MKKIISLLLVSLMVLALVSCGGGGGGASQNQKVKFNIDDYVVEYKGFELLKDNDGNDAIAVNYSFTNNSENEAQFVWSVLSTYEQNATVLAPALITVDEEALTYMDDSSTDAVMPGETKDVTVTYVLNDTTSPITVTLLSSDFTSESFKIDPSKADAPEVSDDAEEEQQEIIEISDDGLLANTEWYGWWMIADATGDYEDYEGEYYDCCAAFEKTNEGYTLMSIWDEIYPDYENDCLGEIYFEEVDGMLVSEEGGFFYTGEAVGKEKVIIDLDFTDYEKTLFTTVEVEDDNGSFIAVINLTEWGYEWNENLAGLPTYYESYFLPLMEDGESLPYDISDIG